MHWRSAARRGSKWACTIAAAACVVAFGVSLVWSVGWIGSSSRWVVALDPGIIAGSWGHPSNSSPLLQTGLVRYRRTAEALHWWPAISSTPTYTSAVLPLWISFLITSIPAAWLWRWDRRAARLASTGSCAGCGYDRRGLSPDAK